MAIIPFVTKKGGTGKSTSVVHVAQCLHDKGHKVCILDTDKKQTSVDNFARKRKLLAMEPEAENFDLSYPAVQCIYEDDNYREFIEKIQDRFDFILVDTKGDFDQFHYDLLRYAELVVCPIAPSELDYDASELVHKAVTHENRQRSEDQNALSLVYSVNQADGSNTLKHVKSLIETKLDRPVLTPDIRMSDAIKAPMGAGLTVFDLAKNYHTGKQLLNLNRDSKNQSHLTKNIVNSLSDDFEQMVENLLSYLPRKVIES